MNINKIIKSTLISATITTFFIVCLTIAGELYKITGPDGKVINPVKDYLKSLHGHHWVGKGIWAVILFTVLSILFYFACRADVPEQKIGRYISIFSWTLIVCTSAFFVFFAYEYIASH